MKDISVFKEFGDIYKFLDQAFINEDVDNILHWYHHCLKYFPPVVYEKVPELLSNLKNKDCFIQILRELYVSCPDIVYTYASQKTLWHEGVYGTQIEVENPYKSDRIMIYSKKFSENWASSQECYRPSIEALCKKYNVLLVSPSSSPASSYYKSLGEYLEIPVANSSLDTIKTMICGYKPRVFIEMNAMSIPLSLTMNQTYTALIMGDTVVETPHASRRMPDFAISGTPTGRRAIPGNKIKFSEPVMDYFMPRNGDTRNYLITDQKKFNKKEIWFGAFCRLGKLDLTTLNTWANALRYFPSSTLFFAYIQTNKISEYYTKKYFESLSIDPSRIKFYPRLSTNNYLIELSKMDIAFGASPEQGGCSCTDALGVGIPYIVNEMNSITTTASHILTSIGKSEWSVKSDTAFINIIEQLLDNHEATNNFFTRSKLRKDVMYQMEQDREHYHKELFKMLDQAITR